MNSNTIESVKMFDITHFICYINISIAKNVDLTCIRSYSATQRMADISSCVIM